LTYTALASVPWATLKPGDTVAVHYNGTGGYHEKIFMTQSGTASCPITLAGIADPTTGNLPIIDGQNATTAANAVPSYKPLETNSLMLLWSDVYPNTINYITIQGLEIRNANYTNSYRDENGVVTAYNGFVAGLYAVGTSHLTVKNCTFDGNGIAVFDNSNGSYNSDNTYIGYNYFYNNGYFNGQTSDTHTMYNEVDKITYEFNYFGPQNSTAVGNQIKDRSAGTVIRYNYVGGPGGHIFDLVDPEDNQVLATLPEFKDTYVYGNVILNTPISGVAPAYTPVHFGGDSGLNDYRNGNLEFYDNTVINLINQSTYWRLNMFELDGGGTVLATNNIFYNAPVTAGANPPIFEFVGTSGGNITFSPTNWVSPGWLASEAAELGQSYGGTITGTNTFISPSSNNPGFVNLAGGNYSLVSGSSAAGIAGALGAGWPTVTMQPATGVPPSGTARSDTNLGAF